MAKRMIWHDTRLMGSAPPIAQNIYNVDASVKLDHALGWITNYARTQGGLDELLIMCHGYEADWDLGGQACTGTDVGGFGLQICDEGISLGNASKLLIWGSDKIFPLIKLITIYSCAAADTGAGNQGTWGDGKRFMGEFAMFSGAFVVAAEQTQYYTYKDVSGLFAFTSKPIDFGDWEGPVYKFDPTNGVATLYQPGPMK